VQKIEWMLTEASADGMDLDTNDINWIIFHQGDGGIETDPAVIDYVLELDQEWHQMT